ncbi:hypothetical protein VTL71DRAFT_12950 [Oculimacula yallundae]|uniref:Uncharacterized protein n=1 Tax=Oculimacula yallundae TaxID=86028 RepID=A0ABR4CP76_9HELO
MRSTIFMLVLSILAVAKADHVNINIDTNTNTNNNKQHVLSPTGGDDDSPPTDPSISYPTNCPAFTPPDAKRTRWITFYKDDGTKEEVCVTVGAFCADDADCEKSAFLDNECPAGATFSPELAFCDGYRCVAEERAGKEDVGKSCDCLQGCYMGVDGKVEEGEVSLVCGDKGKCVKNEKK